MIKINGLRINIVTKEGLFGNEFSFKKGLNIIRGNNSSGKSTVFQSILFGLGMEELIGGKNTSALQYVLKEKIITDNGDLPVIESNILLEILNQGGDVCTVQRYITNEKYDPRYVRVYNGALITGKIDSDTDYTEMYLHDKNAAKNIQFGFHAYLEKFIGISLPNVRYSDGVERKLYLQTIFPAFVIEQKNGWSDFLSTIPYYKIKDPKAKVIEFILNLDVLENQKRKNQLSFQKKLIESQWEQMYLNFKELISSDFFEIQGLDMTPFIFKPEDKIYIRRLVEEGEYENIDEYLARLKSQLDKIIEKDIPKTSETVDALAKRAEQLGNSISKANIEKQSLGNEVEILRKELKEYKRDYANTIQDLESYLAYKKVKDFASEKNLTISTEFCPTCGQDIKDTLLPQEINQDYMKLDDNIEHLKAQKEMYATFITGQQDKLLNLKSRLNRIENTIKNNRSVLKSINRELVSDDRLPSQFLIEKKIRLENQLKHYERLREKVNKTINDFRMLSREYAKLQGQLKDLPKNFYSDNDMKKLKFFNICFKDLLKKFNYRSYDVNDISIPYDGYFPTVKGLNLVKNFEDKRVEGKLKHNSSASDFVRAIWAYTIAIYKTSLNFKTNHPGILIFDEPSQHDMANADMNSFLSELSHFNEGESIVFASFGERDENFKEETRGLSKFNLYDLSKLEKVLKFKSEL